MSKKRPPKITLCLDGKRIDSGKFVSGVAAFFKMLREVSSEVAANADVKGRRIFWNVSVKPGSLCIVASPEIEDDTGMEIAENVIHALDSGLDVLGKNADRPPHFTDQILRSISGLTSLRDENLSKIAVHIGRGRRTLSPKTHDNVQAVFGTAHKAYGSIDGRLQTISKRRGSKFVVYDTVTDRPVKCFFPETMTEPIKNAFGKRVTVNGTIRYGRDGEPVNISVETVEVFPSREELPSINDVRGILSAKPQ